LIDAYTSEIRASYRPYNALDEMESPTVVTFTPDGSRIFSAGFKTDRMIQVFDTAIPGRDASTLRLGKTRRSKDGQKGICSALSFPSGSNNVFGSTKSNIFAVGTYSPGSIYIYDDRRPSGDPAGTVLNGGMCVVGHGKGFTRKKRRFADTNDETQNDNGNEEDIFSMAKVNWYQNRARGGITQLEWSPNSDFYLYSASRRSDAILAWDMRVLTGSESHPVRGIMSFPRQSDTNQRLEFDLSEDGNHLYTASQDQTVKIYDTRNSNLIKTIDSFNHVVNGVSVQKDLNGVEILAVATGSRIFKENYDEFNENNISCDNEKGSTGASIFDSQGSLSLFGTKNLCSNK
jgi:WD40 repeat protein